ncbi:unnamed protein product [Amaranthus hypochondriacus]
MPPNSLFRLPSPVTTIFFSHFYFTPPFSSCSSSLFEDNFRTLPNFITQKPISQHRQWSQIINTDIQKRELLFTLLQSCSLYTHFLQLHTQFIRNYLIHHPRLSLKFLSRSVKICPNNVSYIYRIFSQISMRNLSHFNTMLRAFSCSSFPLDGFKFYGMMMRKSVFPDYLTLSFCIDCCTKSCALVEGMQIHGSIVINGCGRDCVMMTSLMELYSENGRCDDACKLFDEMRYRDCASYNALISCFLNNKRTRDTFSVFESMKNLGRDCRPNDVTCLLLLQACGNIGALEFGRSVGIYIQKHGYGELKKLNNALITMYSKCGSVDEAYGIFEKMPVKDLVSWSSMISGLGMNGYGRYAFEMFWEMQRTGISPDEKVITAVLYACSYNGLLLEGLLLFEKMTLEFGILPNIHHYGCVVDILGRLGSLDQAYDLIISMESKPDVKIWRTLLKACRVHKNFGLAEQVVEHIVEHKGKETEDYVLLLNTYSSNGQWNKVQELREYMNEKGIQIPRGCSTIELKGTVHEFVVNDVSHTRKDEIYEKLSEILQQLKIAGYMPEAPSELHNLNVIEKECRVSYHSEKLAIAFGFLCTPPGITIRVASNVPICSDCHKFCKLLSAVYNRKVIIRDESRIHVFREGKCSCDDCW